MRSVIQFEIYEGKLVALADDGTLWILYGSYLNFQWSRLPSLPGDES